MKKAWLARLEKLADDVIAEATAAPEGHPDKAAGFLLAGTLLDLCGLFLFEDTTRSASAALDEMCRAKQSENWK